MPNTGEDHEGYYEKDIVKIKKMPDVDVQSLAMTFEDIIHINNVVWKCNEQANRAGWPEREIGTMIALCHSELSEALEGVRKDLMDEHLPHRKMVEVELADCVIRIFNLAGKLKLINFGAAIAEKHAYNADRADHKLENRQKAGGKQF